MGPGAIKVRKRSKTQPRPALLFFPANAKIYDRDHPCQKTYFVESGYIRLSSDRKAILAHLTPGCFFGEKSVLKPMPPDQRAICLSPATVRTFRTSELLDHLQNDRRFALRFVKNLAFRIEQYEQTICDFVAHGAEYRLAQTLLRIAPARPASGWVRLPISPTNPELSRMAGTTRSRISKFMRHFQASGWLRREQGLWILREGLCEFLAAIETATAAASQPQSTSTEDLWQDEAPVSNPES